MGDTTTPILGLIKPAVGASRDSWGNKWNGNADGLDSNFGTIQSQIATLQGQVNTILATMLPNTGGIISGQLIVQGNLYAESGRLFSGPGPSGDPNICLWDSVAGFAFGWRATADALYASGMDGAGNALTNLVWIDPSGNLSAAGQVSASYLNSAGSIYAAGNIYAQGQYNGNVLNITGNAYCGPLFANGDIGANGNLWTENAWGIINYSIDPTYYHAQWLDDNVGLYPVVDGSSWLGPYQLQNSDRRLKRNIGECGDALADLRRFRVVSFDTVFGNVRQRFGLIADEVGEHAPDCSPVPSRPDASRGIDLRPVMARCVRAIQQLEQRVIQLERGG